eukprot:TRINITY_DN772_c0_g1_i12.p1 TRINITY_DN772_c0_g1~~TRINITY_DN772_c0_g1_i12.p1  ORF type:complete len:163 (+),score=65.12 TRINITY_DN772_c0_g1_i12:1-489(+)
MRVYSGSGGSHGGVGAVGCFTENPDVEDTEYIQSKPANTYGSTKEPFEFGGAGGYGISNNSTFASVYDEVEPGFGGGRIKVIADKLLFAYNGRFSAAGKSTNYFAGAGAGGSIWLTANKMLKHPKGVGFMNVNGGQSSVANLQGGGAGEFEVIFVYQGTMNG